MQLLPDPYLYNHFTKITYIVWPFCPFYRKLNILRDKYVVEIRGEI